MNNPLGVSPSEGIPTRANAQWVIFSFKRRTPIKRRPRLNAGSELLIFE